MDAVEHLLDLEAIRQLKYRYCRCVDTKDWEGLAECFDEYATARYPQATCQSREEIIDFLSGVMFPELVTMHHAHHPEITVDGDTATAVWYLHDKVFSPVSHFALEGSALYTDHYVRTDEGWFISHTGYARIFQVTYQTNDIPGYRVEQSALSRGDQSAGSQ